MSSSSKTDGVKPSKPAAVPMEAGKAHAGTQGDADATHQEPHTLLITTTSEAKGADAELERVFTRLHDLMAKGLITSSEASAARVDALNTYIRASQQEEKADPTRILSDQIRDQRLEKIYPIMTRTMAHREEIAAIMTLSQEQLRDQFRDGCKNSSITADRVLILHYMLYGGEHDRHVFASWLLTKTDAELIQSHNLLVAGQRTEADPFMKTHGERLLRLQWPLFPPAADFSAVNVKLLKETDAEPTGGGRHIVPTVYARPDRTSAITGGEYWAPVQDTPKGPYVDLTPLETAHNQHAASITALEQQIAQMQRQAQAMRNASRGRGSNGRGYNGGYNGNGYNNGGYNAGRGYGSRGSGYRRGGVRGGAEQGDSHTNAAQAGASNTTADF